MANNTDTKRILVVDDVAVNVQLLTTYLTSEGYEVIPAKDGAEAVEVVKQHKLDLILLDVMMPKLNGFEVCKIIKSDLDTQFVPVILVTALNELEDKVKGMEAGADDFLTKPFNKLELLVRVRSLIRTKYLHDELQNKIVELEKTNAQLEEAKEELRELAITDGLTGLYNYRYFKDQLKQELSRAKRHDLHISLAMLDIDFFKLYNDTNGHPAGDLVLQEIAKLLKNNIRKIDVAARYGGEEFSLVLIETDKPSAEVVAEKIRRLVEQYPFQFEDKQPNKKVTISMGVATFPEDAGDYAKMVSVADERLYCAKQTGKNTVVANSLRDE